MTASPPDPTYAPPHAPWLCVLAADDSFLAISKPSGLLSVPGKTPDLADCVEARSRGVFPDARIVHRLDRDTSGVILLARGAAAHRALSAQFANRVVEKTYIARVAGAVAGESGLIDAPLMADWPNRPRQKIDPAGKPSRTEWRVLAREGPATRLSLTPETGRSHQLRVHLLSLGHPILGDPLYGDAASADRLQLHAEALVFRHPADGRALSVVDPCPF